MAAPVSGRSMCVKLKAVQSAYVFVGIFIGLPFGPAETKRKPHLRCTYQVAAVEALECFI